MLSPENNLIQLKKDIRNKFSNLRKNIFQQEREEKSNLIFDNFVKLFYSDHLKQYRQKKFSLYLPINNEVETKKIEQFFIKNNIVFGYPKIISRNQELLFIKNSPQKKLINSQFYKNLPEINDNETIEPDILIIPLLAFDKSLSRLGMGGGFFDRTIQHLRSQNSRLITIGLAYDFQEFDELLPINNKDEKLNIIITNNEFFL